MSILVNFENQYPPQLEKLKGDETVAVKKLENGKKVKTGSREKNHSAVDVADDDLNMSFAKNEKTTSQELFSHLFEC